MMSITEHELTTIWECVKQLKDCAEFLIKSAEDIENEVKELTTTPTSSQKAATAEPVNTTITSSSWTPPTSSSSNTDKKDHTKNYEKMRKSIKKIYKEGKQKMQNVGKTIKDAVDESNLDATSLAEEDAVDDLVINETMNASSTSTATENDNCEKSKETKPKTTTEPDKNTVNCEERNGHPPKENGDDDSPEFLQAIKSEENIDISETGKLSSDDSKHTKIRLVAIEKLLDPKVIASSSNSRNLRRLPPPSIPAYSSPSIINLSSSIIILDSDDESSPEVVTAKSVSANNNAANGIVRIQNGENNLSRAEDKGSGGVRERNNKDSSSQLPSSTKTLKIRIKKCKIIESVVKAGKRHIKISKVPDAVCHSSTDSGANGEAKSSKRQRRDSSINRSDHIERVVSDDDSDFVRSKRSRIEKHSHRRHKSSSHKSSRSHRERSRSRRNHSDEDRLKKHKEDKEKEGRRRDHRHDKPSTSSKHKSSSSRRSTSSSLRRNRTIDSDDDNAENHNKSPENNIANVDEVESQLAKLMECGVEADDDNIASASKTPNDKEQRSNDAEKPESDKKNASHKSNKSNKSKSDHSSSEDETISSIKEKASGKSSEKSSNSKESDKEEEKQKRKSDDSSDEEIIKTKSRHCKRKRIRTSSNSDSAPDDKKSTDDKDSDYDDDDDSDSGGKGKRNNRRNKKKKGKVKKNRDESGSESDENIKRKNIRKIITKHNLDDSTKKATEAERERRKRVEDRQKLYNKIFEKPEQAEIDTAVLDFDPETKEEILSIDKGLLKKMKPHQVQGVKFMWDACFETVKDIKEKPGSGCILGHCMGLGKTLQVVALAHTILANNDKTDMSTVLVITPLSTVTNWAKEFHMWMKYCKYKDIEVYDMSKYKDKKLRAYKLQEWQEDGGVCIIGYDMYRILANPKVAGGKRFRETLQKSLVDPGPDLIVCDEGHLLKNEKTSISKAVSQIRTLRRIVLSGTPLQNNLKEYYCMVQFVKPNLLGTYKEYLNRFVNPITNGQYTDSTDRDIRLMKHRSHILHKMLEGCIQRRDYSVLAPYLPPKHEYVVFISMSEIQNKLYEHYMKNERRVDANVGGGGVKGTALFRDFQNLRRIWTHPMALRVNSQEVKKKKERKAMLDDENSLDDFIDDETSESESSSSDSDNSDSSGKPRKKNNSKSASASRSTRKNPNAVEPPQVEEEEEQCESEWWKAICSESELTKIYNSPKLLLLFEILQECETIGDKILLFSQSLQSLNVIEEFLALIHRKTQGVNEECDVNGFIGSWKLGLDYFRLDGSNTVESRELMCRRFNNTSDFRSRLFLISTRAGSLGINLVAANRVIIFDASWNPSHDTQSIFRVYRFGQEKPCYIYRFIAKGTMEEKVYERQVIKQATAKRVIDEHQIGRHYNSNDLMELYQYDLSVPEVREVPILPKDRLFAELIKKHEQYIIKYHEHDSLLENKESENLNEDERKAAWAEYETEKNQPAQPQYGAYTRPNYRNGPVTSSKIFGFRSDVLLRLLNLKVRRDHPQLTDMEVGQLVPIYLRQLYDQMNGGQLALFTELNEMNRAFEMPTGFSENPMNSNYIINPFYQPPAQQNSDPTYIHEID